MDPNEHPPRAQNEEVASSANPRQPISIIEENASFKNRASSQIGKRQSYREPITHVKNRSVFEFLFGSCFGNTSTQLSYEELVPYYDLKNDANIYFDNKCTDYDDMFRDLWNALTGETLEQVQNEGWKNYGFQNANPRSDIRGGALLSLKQLIYFVKANKERIAEMNSDPSTFLFGVSSINISYFLIKYYHLSDQLAFAKDKKELCSRIALKSFCGLQRVDENTFNKIHSILFSDLFKVWEDLKRKIPGLTLLDFNMALKIVKAKFIRVTRKNTFDSLRTMKAYYDRVETVLPSRKESFS